MSFFQDVQNADYEFQVKFAYVNYNLSDFIQVGFFDARMP
jgi:hypothetical protein